MTLLNKILIAAVVALGVVCGFQWVRITKLDNEKKTAALQHTADSLQIQQSIRMWRFREARMLFTADSASKAAQVADSTILLTQQWFNEHRQSLPTADAARLKSIILWRTK